MSLVLQSSGGGSVTLQEAVTASNLTITVPAVTGTMITTASTFAGTGPAFSAFQSTLQSISTANWTKVQLQTEEFDTANCFDNATNYRFTPNVSGYYQVNGSVNIAGSTGNNYICGLYKNGSIARHGNQISVNPANNTQPILSTIIYLNGTTDYIELYAYQASGGTVNTLNGSPYTYFQAFLARAE